MQACHVWLLRTSQESPSQLAGLRSIESHQQDQYMHHHGDQAEDTAFGNEQNQGEREPMEAP